MEANGQFLLSQLQQFPASDPAGDRRRGQALIVCTSSSTPLPLWALTRSTGRLSRSSDGIKGRADLGLDVLGPGQVALVDDDHVGHHPARRPSPLQVVARLRLQQQDHDVGEVADGRIALACPTVSISHHSKPNASNNRTISADTPPGPRDRRGPPGCG